MNAKIAQVSLDRIFLRVAVTAVELQSFIADVEADIRRKSLRHGAVRGCIGAARVESRSGAVNHQTSGLKLGCHIGYSELKRLEVGKGLTELLPHAHVHSGGVEASACSTQRTRCDVDPPAIERFHRNLEALPLLPNQVGSGNAAILEDHRRCRLAVPPELLFFFPKREPRGALFDDYTGDASWALISRSDHTDINVARTRPRDEGLFTV